MTRNKRGGSKHERRRRQKRRCTSSLCTHHERRVILVSRVPPVVTLDHIGKELDGREEVSEILQHGAHRNAQLGLVDQVSVILLVEDLKALRKPLLHCLDQQHVAILLIGARQEHEALEEVFEDW